MKQIINNIKAGISSMRFSEPGLEEKYIENYHEINAGIIRILYIIGAIAYIVFFVLMYIFKPTVNLRCMTMCFVLPIMLFVLFLILSFSRFSKKIFQAGLVVTITAFQTGLLVLSVIYPISDFYIIHTYFIITLIAGYVYLRIRFSYSILLFIIISIIHTISYFIVSSLPMEHLIVLVLHYCSSSFVGFFANYRIEKNDRHNFYRLNIIVADRIEISKLKKN